MMDQEEPKEPTGPDCEFPDYDIIRHSSKLGIKNPMDARWELLGSTASMEPAVHVNPVCCRTKSKRLVTLQKFFDTYIGRCPICNWIYWMKRTSKP